MDVQLLIWDSSGQWCLERNGRPPGVRVPEGAAVEPPSVLLEAVKATWQFDAAFVRVAAKDIAEIEYVDAKSPDSGLVWRRSPPIPDRDTRAAWLRPGWLGAILPGVDQELTAAGLTRMGNPEQVRHTSVTGLLRIATDSSPVWVKAGLPLFAHESRVLRFLRHIGISCVPRVVADGDGWWIGESFPRPVASPSGHFLSELASIQLATTAHLAELRDLGCPDRPLSSQGAELALLAGRSDLLDRSRRAGLRSVLAEHEDLCARVDSLGIPPSLVHGDCNAENVLHTEAGWFLFDWTDACVSHPFIDTVLATKGLSVVDRARALDDYADRWSSVVSRRQIEFGLRAAPIFGAAHQAVTYRWILDQVDWAGADVSDSNQLLGLLRHWVDKVIAADWKALW